MTGVPPTTVKKAVASGQLVCSDVNSKVRVVLHEDIVAWLRRHRSVPASREVVEVIKQKQKKRRSGRSVIPPELDADGRQQAKYEDLKRQLERDQGIRQ